MPRPGPRREMVWVRLLPDGITALDKRAAAEGCTRSELIRRLLVYGLKVMPDGWKS